MLRISVLGPIEVLRDDRRLSLPSGKSSELLVRLALEAGTRVRSDRLIEDLWAHDAVRTRRNTLQSKISHLRRALQEPDVLVAVDGGYRLAVDPSAVDAVAVIDLSREAARLLDAGEHLEASELCASALAMYRGDVLAGAGEWAAPHRARLGAARLELVEVQLKARLHLGDLNVIGDAEAAVEEHPYQEELWLVLITALYRAGRQADALATAHRVRRLLADDLGLLPGPGLTDLEHQLLAQDESLADGRRSNVPIAEPRIVGNLPSTSSELVGRDREVAHVGTLLATSRLVELVGPGGVGKTALAIAVGRAVRRHDGVWIARLETATTADDVVDTVVAAMNVSGGEAAMLERLRRAEAVVILDNCEHVLAAAADLAMRMLDAAPGLQLLCTTQVPLEIDGETIVELDPLGLDDAVELFTVRARQGRVTGDAPEAVADLCRSLDGLPLAIELAAARTRTLSIEEIGRRLDDRFELLRDPTSRKPERRRALGATLSWSYDLLFPDDQRGLWALSTFPGGASLDAVEHVLEALAVPRRAAIDILDRLVTRSFLRADPDEGPGGRRYRLLDSIRAFSANAMSAAGLTDVARNANARWYATAAAASTEGVRSDGQAEHLAFVRSERANIDAVLTWSARHDPLLGLGVAIGFGWAWVVLGDSRGAQRLLTVLDAAAGRAPAAQQASALLLSSWIEASTGELERAEAHISAAADLAEAIDDDELRARCCYHLAYVVSHDGDFQRAQELTERSRSLYERLDLPWDQAANALFAARAAISAGDEARSVAEADHVQHWLSIVDDPWLHVRRDAMLGELARLQRRFPDAVDHIARAAATSQRRGYPQTEAYQVASLGRAQCQAGDHATGAATLREAVDKAEAIGDVRMAALARVHLGRVLRALGDTDGARLALESAVSWHSAAGGGEQARLGECLLAAMDANEQRPDVERRLTDVLAAARVHGEPHVEVFALDALARIAARSGDLDAAESLHAEADERMRAADHFITARDRVDAGVIVDDPPAG